MLEDITSLASRLGLNVRSPADGDFRRIEEIARSSFTVPVWLMEFEENRVHYHRDWLMCDESGKRHIAVAFGPRGRPAGYVYYVVRHDREVYIKELAATPPDSEDRIPLAGTCVLGYALADALSRGGVDTVVLNVPYAHRDTLSSADGRVVWRSPVGYYTRFGFAIQRDHAGYTVSGGRRSEGDTWMRAEIRTAYEGVTRILRCV